MYNGGESLASKCAVLVTRAAHALTELFTTSQTCINLFFRAMMSWSVLAHSGLIVAFRLVQVSLNFSTMNTILKFAALLALNWCVIIKPNLKYLPPVLPARLISTHDHNVYGNL